MGLSTLYQLSGIATKEAVDELGPAEGTKATVLVKSTEVMLGVE